VDCGKLDSLSHGTKSGTSTSYGTKVTFTCNPGYRLSGSSSRTCRADGTWEGIQPTCEIQQCAALSVPNFGRVSAANRTYGMTLTLECYRGYRLTGSSTRTCAAARDGTLHWTGTQTACTIVDCGSLLTPANGFKLQNLTTYEAKVSFSCRTGYILVGSSMRRCGADGRWDGMQPSCESKVERLNAGS
jgi:CUB/sushi domain-containing protein